MIYASAQLLENSALGGTCQVTGTSIITDNAKAFERASISAGSVISGNAVASGNSWICNSCISGITFVSGDTILRDQNLN